MRITSKTHSTLQLVEIGIKKNKSPHLMSIGNLTSVQQNALNAYRIAKLVEFPKILKIPQKIWIKKNIKKSFFYQKKKYYTHY